MGGTYDLLNTVTASEGATGLEISSIDQTYNDLVIYFEVCGDSSNNENMNGYIRFNDITSTDYVMQNFYSVDSGNYTTGNVKNTRVWSGTYFQLYNMSTGATSPRNLEFSTYKITIPNYRRLNVPSGTQYQPMILEMNCLNTTGSTYSNGFGFASWSLTAANSVQINKIAYTGNNQNFGLKAGSNIKVYGIKYS
jgi:hypothetical protein